MALFTDTTISTLDQLAAQDTAVLDVASAEGIDVAAKLFLAQSEIGVELTAAAARSPFSPSAPSIWWPGMILTSAVDLACVVVTPPLQMWHAFHTLAIVYRDAYFNQLNDRYLGKWNAYKDLSKWACGLLLQTGLGIVADPIPIALPPQVRVTAGTFSAADYYIQTSWSNARQEEGLASPIASIATTDNSSVQVVPTSAPPNATGWNIYVGSSVDSLTLQNGCALGTDQSWSLPPGGLSIGRRPGSGQAPNYYRPLPRYLPRG